MPRNDKKAAFEAVNAYNAEHYDRITVMVSKGKKAELKALAAAHNMSLNALIVEAINEKVWWETE